MAKRNLMNNLIWQKIRLKYTPKLHKNSINVNNSIFILLLLLKKLVANIINNPKAEQ